MQFFCNAMPRNNYRVSYINCLSGRSSLSYRCAVYAAIILSPTFVTFDDEFPGPLPLPPVVWPPQQAYLRPTCAFQEAFQSKYVSEPGRCDEIYSTYQNPHGEFFANNQSYFKVHVHVFHFKLDQVLFFFLDPC